MKFSTNWDVVSDCSAIKKGVVLTANSDGFQAVNLNTGTRSFVSRGSLISDDYKYRNEILYSILKSVNSLGEKDLTLDEAAAKLVDDLCEANRLLY